MTETRLETVTTLDVETDKLLRNNATSAMRRMSRKIPGKRQWILARGQDDALVAGARFASALGWMTVDAIWVQEDLRRQGMGSRLLGAVEDAARSEGCKGVQLRAYGFEGAEFFSRKGYVRVGFIPDADPELASSWFAKGFTVSLEAPTAEAPSVEPEAPGAWREAKRAARTAKSKTKAK